MSAKEVCPICNGTGFVARSDRFEPAITVHYPCPMFCLPLSSDYAEGYQPNEPMTWPEWMRHGGVSLCHPTAKTSDGLVVMVEPRDATKNDPDALTWDFNDQETFQP